MALEACGREKRNPDWGVGASKLLRNDARPRLYERYRMSVSSEVEPWKEERWCYDDRERCPAFDSPDSGIRDTFGGGKL